jgi:hypothetical protein
LCQGTFHNLSARGSGETSFCVRLRGGVLVWTDPYRSGLDQARQAQSGLFWSGPGRPDLNLSSMVRTGLGKSGLILHCRGCSRGTDCVWPRLVLTGHPWSRLARASPTRSGLVWLGLAVQIGQDRPVPAFNYLDRPEPASGQSRPIKTSQDSSRPTSDGVSILDRCTLTLTCPDQVLHGLDRL